MAKKILIVDDEPDILKVLIFRLKKKGYEVVTANNGRQGLEIAINNDFDFFLFDLCLPEVRGDDICRALKDLPQKRDIPSLIITASSGKVKEVIKDCGAKGYILKPFDSEELILKIENLIADYT